MLTCTGITRGAVELVGLPIAAPTEEQPLAKPHVLG
jgi:hypothetical protein